MMEIDENLKARTPREEERRGWIDGGEKEKELEFLGVLQVFHIFNIIFCKKIYYVCHVEIKKKSKN